MNESEPSNVVECIPTEDIPPEITHVPLISCRAGDTLTFNAAITDNVGVTGAELNYRFVPNETWSTLPMRNISGSNYRTTLNVYEESDIEYYITASDGTNTGFCGTSDAPLTISCIRPVSIEIISLPDKTLYAVGDEFDATGLAVSVIFSDGSKEPLSLDDYDISFDDSEEFDSTSAKTVIVGIDYNFKHTEFTVSVVEADVIAVVAAINAIPAEVTADDRDLIIEARTLYENLTNSQKSLISEDLLAKLIAAEAALESIGQSDQDLSAASAVDELIAAIGDAEYTTEFKALIDAARSAYDDLTDTQKSLVTNYEKLIKAESDYSTLQIEDVKDKINAIGDVELTDESKALITAARDAYNSLTDDQKAYVSNSIALIYAEKLYDMLETVAQAEADKQAALDEAAKQAEADKQAALDEAEKQAEADKQAADQAAADNVINKINAIGEVENTNDCENAIIAARSAYDTLTDNQKSLVTNYNVLTEAESEYNMLPQTGMSGFHKVIVAMAVLMGITGIGLVKKSRKEDEE